MILVTLNVAYVVVTDNVSYFLPATSNTVVAAVPDKLVPSMTTVHQLFVVS